MFSFILLHALVFAALTAAAWGAGSLVARRLVFGSAAGLVSLRIAMGLALLGLVLFVLGLAGALTPVASATVTAVALATAAVSVRDLCRTRSLRGRKSPGCERGVGGPDSIESSSRRTTTLLRFGRILARRSTFSPSGVSTAQTPSGEDMFVPVVLALAATPLGVLALYPPIAFDETLYHLPTVERFAATGGLPFIAHLRVPVFPHLDEVLRVPLFQLGGDVATHLLSILATLVTAGLLLAWFTEKGDAAAGWLASALFLSAPLVVQLATTGYVEALLTMFVTASFYALDRWRDSEEVGWLLAAGVFAGCSASVKYLGLFWVGVSFLLVLAHGGRRMRSALLFALAVCLALAPWYGRIVYYSGNPLFPFASGIFGSTAWDIVTEEPRTLGDRCLALVRLPWDLLFARERAGLQPPFSPFLLALIPLAAMRAFGNGLVRALLIITLAWSVVWLWLPADARYLEPAIPLACVAGTIAVREVLIRGTKDRRRLFAVAAIVVLSPSVLYALYRIDRNGAIPLDRPGRDAFLSARVPEYGAIAFMNARSDENDVAWLCGGEQLAYHYRGEMFGDFAGAARFTLLTSARDERELATRAKSLDARYLLIVKRSCSIPALESGSPLSQFARVYDDQVTTVYERTAVRNAD